MGVSRRTQLAQARRNLRRIEEDEPAFRIRISGFSSEQQTFAMHWFEEIRNKQRAYVLQLEADLEKS